MRSHCGSSPCRKHRASPILRRKTGRIAGDDRDELPEWLSKAGFADVIPTIDMATVAANLPKVSHAMETCIPESFVRVPGVGLQRRTAAAVNQES